MATFLEVAAHSVDHMFPLYYDCLWFWLFPVLVLGLDFGSDRFNSWSLHTFTFFIFCGCTALFMPDLVGNPETDFHVTRLSSFIIRRWFIFVWCIKSINLSFVKICIDVL